MEINHGYRVEEAMKKWFRGKSHPLGCVDFQTKKKLYEVKSCRLFVECSNGNDKRAYADKPHKKITTTQMGRFFVKLENHKLLLETSIKENKTPKYLFVITIGKQKIYRIKSWKEVDSILRHKMDICPIRIKDLFNEVWEED